MKPLLKAQGPNRITKRNAHGRLAEREKGKGARGGTKTRSVPRKGCICEVVEH